MKVEEYEVYINKFDHEGRGIGFIDNKITFIDGTIPGDKVIVKIINKKKNYNEAKVVRYLKRSDDYIISLCPYFDVCGGCDLQNISYKYQLAFKENKVREILNRFGNVSIDRIAPILAMGDNIFYYRNKLTFQVKEKIGLFGKNSYDLVAVDKCYIASSVINDILSKIKKMIDLKNIKQVMIRNSFDNNKVMLIFVGENIDLNNIKKMSNYVSSLYVNSNGEYKLVNGEKTIEEKLGNYIFRISPDSFFQVNSKMCVNLYNKIIEYGNFKGTENVLDLYCGTGTIGIYISKFVNHVIGYEINEFAVKDAEINKKINLVDNVDFYCGSSELSFDNITNNIDVIIVDPPRSGLNKKTIDGIINVKTCKVIYVSCDPVTLARDLKMLSNDYDVIEVTPVDMFPNTKHVECVCLLKLR